MTRSRKRKLRRTQATWAGLPLATAILTCSPPVFAQQADEGGVLEEVLVTAQKRSENLQKVPISITALGTDKLDQLQIASFDDYAKFLPSVSYQSTGPSQAQLYFRGIASGGDGLHAGSVPATGVYLDETPVTTIANSLDIHIYDIARVEALSGPQGTLYGASSLSGTLRIITNKPDPSAFSAGYNIEGNTFADGAPGGVLEGYVNIPIAERAAIRLVGFYEKDGGYINNIPQSRTYPLFIPDGDGGVTDDPDDDITINNVAFVEKNFNDVENYGGRAALKIDLNDNWTITPAAIYQHQKSGGTFLYDPRKGDLNVTDFRPDNNLDRWLQSALTIEGRIANLDLVYSGGYFDRKVDAAADYSYYTVAYDQIGYARLYNDDDDLIDPTQYTRFHDVYTKQTHELRVSSPAENRISYVAGLFYQRQTDSIRAEYRIDDLGTFYEVTGQEDVLYLSQQKRIDRDSAIFGEVTFGLTDRLKLTTGIRGFKANNTLFGFFGFNANLSANGEALCGPIPPTGPNMPCVNTNKKVKEEGETHRINLSFQVDSDHLVYATLSTGFRPGGNNRRANVVSYDADTLTNYEVGWKTAWAGGRLRFNGALFFEQWDDVQYGLAGENGITDIFNAGNAEVKGIEADINWLVTDHFSLAASATFLDTKLTTNFCPAPTGVVTTDCDDPNAPVGTELPVTPKFKGNATARYNFDMGGLRSFVQGTVVHQGETRSALEDFDVSLLGNPPEFTTFDFSIGTAGNNWNLEFYMLNAFDERGEINRLGQCAIDQCLQLYRILPTRPQSFGIRFGQKF